MDYPKLFEKGRIGKLTLKNRIVMPAMGTGFASSGGEASDEIIRYYEERAAGGCGLIITEITRIDDETGVGMGCQLSTTKATHIQRLVKLADTVHRHDTRIFLQLHHPGRQTPGRLLGGRQIVAPSAVTCATIGEEPRALTTEECETLVKEFIRGAVIAKTAGIDGVELHAAHGYLIGQFLSPTTNHRTDKYGGDFEGRMRFLTEIIRGIQAMVGPDYPISVRLDGDEFVEGGLKLDDAIQMARYLEGLGVACLNVSCGTYESGYTIIEPNGFAEGWKKHLAKGVRDSVAIPVIAVNTIRHAPVAEQMLEEGVCDFVATGRLFLTDSRWPEKAKAGQETLTRKCLACLYCFKVANMGRPIACTINPVLGRETLYNDDTLKKDGDGRAVAVIGGGPAGMQAAGVLARRGFAPVLFEASDALGGAMNQADKPPHKEMISEFIETQKAELEALGVEVRLNTEATVEAVKALHPYGVMLATGGTPIVPRVPGVDGGNVYAYTQVLDGSVNLSGKKIAVIGGGVTGLETAEFLCADNQVTVVEMLDDVGTALYDSAKAVLLKRLTDAGTAILTGKTLTAIAADTVTLAATGTEEASTLDADAVVLALGVRPNQDGLPAFEAAFDKVTRIGDCGACGTIAEALREGNDKAFVF